MLYYRIEPDIYADHGITDSPRLPDDVSFLAGRPISVALPDPLIFTIDHPAGLRPKHLLGDVIPVASNTLIGALRDLEVDNFQTFPAVLRNPATKEEWSDYRAINVLGLVDAADLESCTYSTIMDGDDDVPPLLDFEDLIFLQTKTRGLALFRLLHNNTQMYLLDRVMDGLRAVKPPDGWGITTREVPVK